MAARMGVRRQHHDGRGWPLEGKQPSTARGSEVVVSLSLPAFCPGGSAGYPRP